MVWLNIFSSVRYRKLVPTSHRFTPFLSSSDAPPRWMPPLYLESRNGIAQFLSSAWIYVSHPFTQISVLVVMLLGA